MGWSNPKGGWSNAGQGWYSARPAAGGSWSPDTAFGSNLVGWYKADTQVNSDAGSTPATDGVGVQQWNDQSGNGNHLSQAGATNKPLFQSASEYNSSFPGVLFETSGGETQFLDTATGAVAATSGVITVFVATRYFSYMDGSGRLLSWTTATPDTGDDWNISGVGADVLSKDGGNNGLQAAYGGAGYSDPTVLTTDTSYRFASIFTGTQIKIALNGSVTSTNSVSTSWGTTGTLRIGCGFGASGPTSRWRGPVQEIIVVKSDASAQLANVETYLTAKWGS
jgi:hypothetical protein